MLDKARDTLDVNQAAKAHKTNPLETACDNGRTPVVELIHNKARDTLDANHADKEPVTALS